MIETPDYLGRLLLVLVVVVLLMASGIELLEWLQRVTAP